MEFIDKNVKLMIDAWKYTFSFKTLGGGYIRFILIFLDDSLIFLETNKIGNLPSYKTGYTDDIFNNIVNSILSEIKDHNTLNKIPEKRENIKVKEILNSLDKNKISYKVKEILPYDQIKHIKIKHKSIASLTKNDIEASLEIFGKKKETYLFYLPDQSLFETIKTRIKELTKNIIE